MREHEISSSSQFHSIQVNLEWLRFKLWEFVAIPSSTPNLTEDNGIQALFEQALMTAVKRTATSDIPAQISILSTKVK